MRSSSVTGTNAHVPYSPELDTALLATCKLCVSWETRHAKIDCVELPYAYVGGQPACVAKA
jgi:hypothetical protein